MLSNNLADIPLNRGWAVNSVFEHPAFGEPYLRTLQEIAADPLSPGLSDVAIRNLLFTHILNLRPRSVLEIGTHIGAGSVVMGQALKANQFGRLLSIEPQQKYREIAMKYLARAELLDWVEVLEGYSNDQAIQAEIAARSPFELIFVDASHDYECVRMEIRCYWELLAANGLMIFHDSGLYAAKFDSMKTGGVRRALMEAEDEIDNFNLLTYEWPLWLNPCGASIAWKKSPAPDPNSTV